MITLRQRIVVPTMLVGALLIGAAATVTPQTAYAAGTRVAPQPNATLVLANSSVKAGSTVKLTAYNFAPNELVALTISGLGSPLASWHASATGTVSATITIPAKLSNGLHLLAATGATSQHTAYAIVIVSGASPAASKTTTQAATTTALVSVTIVGHTLTLTGHNFAAGEKVALLFDHTATPLATVRAAADGTVSTRLTVPFTSGGIIHLLSAVGMTSGRTAIAVFVIK